jgi:hypothetical protein
LRLRVSFEEFGTLWDEIGGFSRNSLRRRKFADDPEFNMPVASAKEIEGVGTFVVALKSQQGQDHIPEPLSEISQNRPYLVQNRGMKGIGHLGAEGYQGDLRQAQTVGGR